MCVSLVVCECVFVLVYYICPVCNFCPSAFLASISWAIVYYILCNALSSAELSVDEVPRIYLDGSGIRVAFLISNKVPEIDLSTDNLGMLYVVSF